MADPFATELNRKISDAGEVAKECDEIEGDLAALRAAYEQYFLGIERQPPSVEHTALKKRLQRLRNNFVRQTALKFRVNNLQNRYLTYERLWQRTIMEIENGTYHRDVYKARMHAKKKDAKEPTKEVPKDPPKDVAKEAPREVARPAAPPPPAAGGGQLSDAKLKAIYDAYVTAKKRCNEDVSKLSYDAVASTLKKQVPALMKQHNAKSVEFKVVIKDGKAVLRAVPKE